jgi:endonuclease G
MSSERQDQAAADRFEDRQKARQERAIRHAKGKLDLQELAALEKRKALIHPNDGLGLERILGASDLLDINFLSIGLRSARPVGRVQVRDKSGRVIEFGTGFMVSPGLMLTCNHVLPAHEACQRSLIDFDYEDDEHFNPKTPISFQLDPWRFFHTNLELDITLVAVKPMANDNETPLSAVGFLPLTGHDGSIVEGEYVGIIQHPLGSTKKLAIRNNRVIDVFGDFIHYTTDTDPGASGAPVFNDYWQAVAIHHAGVKRKDPSGRILAIDGSIWRPEMGEDRIAYVANEGVRIRALLTHLRTLIDIPPEKQVLLDELLMAAEMTPQTSGGPVDQVDAIERPSDEFVTAFGYEPEFLGKRVDLPQLLPQQMADVVERLDGEGHVLDYTHFSIVMSKTRRMAYFTACNIDGRRRQSVTRGRDRWYFDPRIPKEYQAGPDLYSGNDLDRGHLVRRNDPVWGRAAEQANEDSFHFTNAAPQHKHLNQRTWRELEDYVLGNAETHELRVTVFTGPVFRADDIVYRGKYQLPAEFWKVVVIAREDGTLSATGYLQTQKNLLDNLEFAYGSYKTYQIPVARIEAITGLDFGRLRGVDPLGTLEGMDSRLITGKGDILL